MAFLPIYNCFHPIMKQKTEQVKEFDGSLKGLVDDMFETMYKADGLGLAGNQVGKLQSIIVIDTANKEKSGKKPRPMAFINPVIEFFSEEENEFQEGCLSVPTLYENIDRPEMIQVKYFDVNMKEHTIEADELLARVLQHEIDHLNGILFFERLSPLKRALARGKLKKIQNGDLLPSYSMVQPNGSLYIPED
ncbi:MAG: peptide deformylase [Bacteroidota bacterium]|nr:peptide deformylase [Bacteroidota bacterium]